MRHGKKFNHLGRKVGHRKAMLRNMASSLILHKRITTTVAKAKELRKYVEPVITKSKAGDMNARRNAFRYLQDKYAVTELFSEISGKVADRNGGYTRIIKLGARLGDNAEMAMIELVDFNEMYTQSKSKSTGGKRKRRRKSSKAKTDAPVAEAAVAEEVTEIENAVEDVTTEETTEVENLVEEVEESIEVETAVEEEETEEPASEATPVVDEVAEQPEATTETEDENTADDSEGEEASEDKEKTED